MSDVSFARAGWFGQSLFLALFGIVWLIESFPVLITRRRYNELKDLKYIVDDAHRVLADYQRLKNTYEPQED